MTNGARRVFERRLGGESLGAEGLGVAPVSSSISLHFVVSNVHSSRSRHVRVFSPGLHHRAGLLRSYNGFSMMNDAINNNKHQQDDSRGFKSVRKQVVEVKVNTSLKSKF